MPIEASQLAADHCCLQAVPGPHLRLSTAVVACGLVVSL